MYADPAFFEETKQLKHYYTGRTNTQLIEYYTQVLSTTVRGWDIDFVSAETWYESLPLISNFIPSSNTKTDFEFITGHMTFLSESGSDDTTNDLIERNELYGHFF